MCPSQSPLNSCMHPSPSHTRNRVPTTILQNDSRQTGIFATQGNQSSHEDTGRATPACAGPTTDSPGIPSWLFSGCAHPNMAIRRHAERHDTKRRVQSRAAARGPAAAVRDNTAGPCHIECGGDFLPLVDKDAIYAAIVQGLWTGLYTPTQRHHQGGNSRCPRVVLCVAVCHCLPPRELLPRPVPVGGRRPMHHRRENRRRCRRAHLGGGE